MNSSFSALVIAGGTEEPIDDVRVITNRSTGRFGAAIANALTDAGVKVDLLASPRLLEHSEWLRPAISKHPFSSFASLEVALEHQINRIRPDYVFMAAAIADYSPVATQGKLSSNQDEMIIRMRRNPKLISRLRALGGPKATLIGFKLLSNVSTAHLIEIAQAQIATNQLDLCVANDASQISNHHHPIWMVSPNGQVEAAEGSKSEIATALVRHVLAMHKS